MTPGNRRPAPCKRASLVLVCAVAATVLAGCQETLYSGLSEAEVNQMRQVLMRSGIGADKAIGEDGSHVLQVASADAGPALKALESAGLPRSKYASTVDVLKSDALVASPAEDRARLGYAIAQELSATISTFEGAVSARVHLALPEKPVLGVGKVQPASASVFVKYKPGHNMQAAAPAIRELVARSVEGLAPEQVSVVLMPGEVQPVALPPPAGPQDAFGWTALLTLVIGLAAGTSLGGLFGHRSAVARALWAGPAAWLSRRRKGGEHTQAVPAAMDR